MKHKKMKVKIRSGFAVGLTTEYESRSNHGGDMTMEIAPQTTIRELLHKLTSIGPPNEWDDMMLMVFVNGEAQGFDHVFQDGDTIDIHIPAGGG
jgi:molybdopterin converting factor small subunit